jgi:hypothetical protein
MFLHFKSSRRLAAFHLDKIVHPADDRPEAVQKKLPPAGRASKSEVDLCDPTQLFCLSVGELPRASKKVNVVDWSASVSSCVEQPQAGVSLQYLTM